ALIHSPGAAGCPDAPEPDRFAARSPPRLWRTRRFSTGKTQGPPLQLHRLRGANSTAAPRANPHRPIPTGAARDRRTRIHPGKRSLVGPRNVTPAARWSRAMTGDPRHPPLPRVVATADSELARVPRFEPDLGEHPDRAVRSKHVSAQVGVLRA